MSIEAMKQALEALEDFRDDGYDRGICQDVIAALRLTIGQAEKQGPPADKSFRHWAVVMKDTDQTLDGWSRDVTLYFDGIKVAPPQRQPLTERDIASACLSYRHDFGLMEPEERKRLMFQAKEWAHAFGLDAHGIGGEV